ncbi:hypothetical protein DSM104329_02926 [Capillimicrobium parvum]|uniref:Uncharacterized protein n=1 Tax=Capillimicrobium parvum TaxID=2884022 RepID=A0A9E6XYD6_9ACTN|nr:hypothetical protein DSM104329_02926 [Capillimicrobium parvum]
MRSAGEPPGRAGLTTRWCHSSCLMPESTPCSGRWGLFGGPTQTLQVLADSPIVDAARSDPDICPATEGPGVWAVPATTKALPRRRLPRRRLSPASSRRKARATDSDLPRPRRTQARRAAGTAQLTAARRTAERPMTAVDGVSRGRCRREHRRRSMRLSQCAPGQRPRLRAARDRSRTVCSHTWPTRRACRDYAGAPWVRARDAGAASLTSVRSNGSRICEAARRLHGAPRRPCPDEAAGPEFAPKSATSAGEISRVSSLFPCLTWTPQSIPANWPLCKCGGQP